MAYVIVYHKDQELFRRRLAGPVTIGRSPECGLSVHDILLSRAHCRVEPEGDGWVLCDMGSKNGTRVGGNPVTRLPLTDNDVIRMGKTAIRFRTGDLVESSKPKPSSIKRPADPMEALAGTVRDFTFVAKVIAPNGIPLPTPKPSPREPDAYTCDDVRSLVSDLMSSSWDSIYDTIKRPDPVMHRRQEPPAQAVRRNRPREPRVDLALQLSHKAGVEVSSPRPTVRQSRSRPTQVRTQTKPAARQGVGSVVRRLAIIFQWVPLAMLMMK